MSTAYRSVSKSTRRNTEPRGLPLALPIAQLPNATVSATVDSDSALPIRLRANTKVKSRPAYYRVTARSFAHLVEWASKRADFDPSRDFIYYEDESGFAIRLIDESDFQEAIIALESMQANVTSMGPSSTGTSVGRPPSPRGDGRDRRLELWIEKAGHADEWVYRCSESLHDIAHFVNELSPSSVSRIHAVMEFQQRRTTSETVATRGEFESDEKLSTLRESSSYFSNTTATTLLQSSEEDGLTVSLSRSPSPIILTTEVGVTKTIEPQSEVDEETIVYHFWIPHDDSGVNYRFRLASFEAQFGGRDSLDLKLFPQLCIGMIPLSLKDRFGSAASDVLARDLCVCIEEVTDRDLEHERDFSSSFVPGLIAGYGVEYDNVKGRSSFSSLTRRSENDLDLPYTTRRIASAPPQSIYPPHISQLPSQESVFPDRDPVFK